MGFIKFNTGDGREVNKKEFIFSHSEKESFVICKSPAKLQALLAEIAPGTSTHYVSAGDWSMDDLVFELINKYGTCELFLTTYALRETQMRKLILAQESGKVSSINLVIDYRANVRTPEVYQMAKMNCNKICSIAIHAKVCVIKAVNCSITILTSSNWTNNRKIEAGVISMDSNLAQFHIDWINKILDNAELF